MLNILYFVLLTKNYNVRYSLPIPPTNNIKCMLSLSVFTNKVYKMLDTMYLCDSYNAYKMLDIFICATNKVYKMLDTFYL